MRKLHMAEISVAIALIVSFVFSVCSFGTECNKIRENVLRLHILANSDSIEDQNVKLLVRDALLESGGELFKGTVNTENAEIIINNNRNQMVEMINDILKSNGFNYKATVLLTDEYFETRRYENFTLPAGRYKAIKVVLGKGEGHNWWCVMFPPLCLPAASENAELDAVFTENETKIIKNENKYIIQFKIVELFERFKCNICQIK